MNKYVWLDMDGTITDLYAVDGWLDDLRTYNTRPYEQAKAMYDTIELLETLVDLKAKGYKLGVISWGSKTGNLIYNRQVEAVKRNWLAERGLDLLLDKIIVTPYGVCKADTCRQYGEGVLVDDELPNRQAWDLGITIDAKCNILTELRKLQ